MAIGRQILSGLFGATAGGLSGFAQQKAEERARMQRQMEREEERAYQMGLIEQEREYAQRVATERDLLEGRIRRADRPEVDIQPKTLPSQLLRDVVSGTAPGIGMAAGATGPSPLSMARGGREALPEAELRADFTPTAMAPPARELIERGGQFYEVITPEEQAARRLEAERGGLDAIEVARLREVARGSQASPEREGARAALSDIGVSYRTEEETRAIERAERLEDLAAAGDRRVLELAFETLSKANLASLEESKNVLPIDLQAQLVAPLLKAGGLPEEMTESVLRAFAAMSTTPAPSAGEGGGAGTQSPPSLPDVIAQAQRARSGIPELKISLEDFITNILPDIEEVDRELEENSIISQRLLSRGPHGDYRGALSPEELRFSNALPKANRDLLAYRNKLINDVGGREAFEYLNQMVRTRRISGPS
jgi:hypothetical protein